MQLFLEACRQSVLIGGKKPSYGSGAQMKVTCQKKTEKGLV